MSLAAAPQPLPFDVCDFGPFTVIPLRRLLLRNGEPVSIGGRAFDLLLLLLEQHGQMVGKDEILDRVWGERDVEEGNIAVQMSELRRVLGREFLRTYARRGYGFVGPLRFSTALPSSDVASANFAIERASSAWLFGMHVVLPARRLLLRNGQSLPIGGRAFDLLRLLLEHRHRVVTQREMLDRVWVGSPVVVGNIPAQISQLRQLLGRDCIRTVAHRGYQFTADVHWAAELNCASFSSARKLGAIGGSRSAASLGATSTSKGPVLHVA